LLLGWMAMALAASAQGLELHVGPQGSDDNAGTAEAPMSTLSRALDVVRARRRAGTIPPGPTVITLHAGTYRVTKTLTLEAEDSGTEEAPLIIAASPGEEVRFLGGVALTDWQQVSDQSTLSRLPADAREHVVQTDLRSHGITNWGSVTPGTKRAELFFNGKYMTLARYPNDEFLRIAGIPDGASTKRPITDPKRPDLNRYEGPILYKGDRPELWSRAPDVWMHGYWYHDWSDQYHQVLKFDLERRAVWPVPPYHSYGYKKGQRYYFLNILEELDRPGEWYLDRETGILTFWPLSPVAEAEVVFPDLETPMLVLDNARHVILRQITFACSRNSAIVIRGGSHDRVEGCVVRNVGNTGISIEGGVGHEVHSCDVCEVAGTGISVKGGDRKTLTPGGHVVSNCHIHNFARVFKTYRPGVSLQGVGNRVSHCYFHDCPHEGIGYGGNDHVVEYCEFTRIAQETGDVGCLYAAMDWSYTGHVFRYNYFHNIHGPGTLGCFTIYPDLPCGGIHLYGNVFYDVDQIFHTNSGRGMLIENNLFVGARRGLRFNVWMDMKKFQEGGNWRMVERIREVHFDEPPYSVRYPMLARLAEDFAKGPENVLQRAIPKDNVIRRNVSDGQSFFLQVGPQATLEDVRVEQNVICDPAAFIGSPDGDGTARTFRNGDPETNDLLGAAGNLLHQSDPGLVDPEAGDFRIRDDSPARKIGFEPIPFLEIGLQRDEFRTSLPAMEPVIAPSGQFFLERIEVALKLPPRGCASKIRYTLDGGEPKATSTRYEGPIVLTKTTTVRCAAFPVGASGCQPSRVVSAQFRAGSLQSEEGIYLSDLSELEYAGYAPLGLMKDEAYQRRPIHLGGQSYAKGIITHPEKTDEGGRAHVTYRLDGPLAGAKRFTALIGIEDQAPDDMGSCVFAVELRREDQWERIFESPIIRSKDDPVSVDLDISHSDRLRLVAADGGDNISWDHATWANARIR